MAKVFPDTEIFPACDRMRDVFHAVVRSFPKGRSATWPILWKRDDVARKSASPLLVVLEAQMVELAPGGTASAMQEFREAIGLVYVLEGRLHLEVGGLKEVLEEGDCAYIESEMAVAWRGEGKHRCRLLAVLPGAARKEA